MSIEDESGTGLTIKGDDTLEHVGQKAAQFLHLTPENTERFVADWLSEWAKRGLSGRAHRRPGPGP
jgi:hypothetical protein